MSGRLLVFLLALCSRMAPGGLGITHGCKPVDFGNVPKACFMNAGSITYTQLAKGLALLE